MLLLIVMLWRVCDGNTVLLEGMANKISDNKYNEPPLGQNPVYLAALNAANIEYLNNKLIDYQKTKDDLAKVKKGEEQNATALAKIATQLQSAMGNLAPSKPATHANI
jgi:hypothetical protein